jgi:hypothetical protein
MTTTEEENAMISRSLSLFATLSMAVSACGDRSSPTGVADDPAAPNGQATSADGLVTLTVPEGAAPPGTTFTIEDITDTADLMAQGRVYSIGPAGTRFATPATLTLTLPFDPAAVWVGITGEDLSIARLEGDHWLPVESTYDPVSLTLSAEIDHLSSFGAVYTNPAPYSVDDDETFWLWADEWQGFVGSILITETGSFPPGPYSHESTVGTIGEPDLSTVVFAGRAASLTEGIVAWMPAARAAVVYTAARSPAPGDHPCTGSTLMGRGTPEVNHVAFSPESHLVIRASDSRYRLSFAQAPDTELPVFESIDCFLSFEPARSERLIERTVNVPLTTFGGFADAPLVQPALEQLLGVAEAEPAPEIVLDHLHWALQPVHDRAAWREEYAVLVRSRRDFVIRTEMWQQIDDECNAGTRSGIICRAAHAQLRDSQAWLNRWLDDCTRIQGKMVDRAHVPLLSDNGLFDLAVVEGPVGFCEFTHRYLLSFLHPCTHCSVVSFAERLPAEMRRLYGVSDLQRLF